jgi:hypothetical protein
MERGGLPRAIGTHQADDLAGQDLEGQVLDRSEIAVHLPQALDFDH